MLRINNTCNANNIPTHLNEKYYQKILVKIFKQLSGYKFQFLKMKEKYLKNKRSCIVLGRILVADLEACIKNTQLLNFELEIGVRIASSFLHDVHKKYC